VKYQEKFTVVVAGLKIMRHVLGSTMGPQT